MKKKGIALIAALVLLAVSITAGSLAWLTDTTKPVKNTFTTSNIGITLTEEKGEVGKEDHEFKMIPGWTIEKDPKVTVEAGSEPCWLFVKLEKSTNFDKYIAEFEPEDGWEKLNGVDGVDNVYCRMVTDTTEKQEFFVIKDNKLTVKDTVTKADMTEANGKEPTLTVTAYACQLYSTNDTQFTAAQAWDKINPSTTPIT